MGKWRHLLKKKMPNIIFYTFIRRLSSHSTIELKCIDWRFGKLTEMTRSLELFSSIFWILCQRNLDKLYANFSRIFWVNCIWSKSLFHWKPNGIYNNDISFFDRISLIRNQKVFHLGIRTRKPVIRLSKPSTQFRVKWNIEFIHARENIVKSCGDVLYTFSRILSFQTECNDLFISCGTVYWALVWKVLFRTIFSVLKKTLMWFWFIV